jgi:hypothetical protein
MLRMLLLSLTLAALSAKAVIVDGIAITVGNKVITKSQIEQRIRLTAFLNGTKPEITPDAKRETARQLIEQRLVEREMDLGRYPRRGSDATQPLLRALIENTFGGSDAALDARAAEDGVTRTEIGADLAWQADLLSFLNIRFRPAVQVTDDDIQKYFDQNFASALSPDQRASALSELRSRIEEQLTVEGADRELDTWLRDQRRSTKITWLEKDLEPAK